MAPEGRLSMDVHRQLRHMSKSTRLKKGAAEHLELQNESGSLSPGNSTVAVPQFDAAHFEKTLSTKPEERDPADVRLVLDWWLSNLPISGLELAPELQASRHDLYEAFQCGKLVTFNRNQVIQEEGEEVKAYSIVLFGQCRLRCAKPVAAVAPIVPTRDVDKDDGRGRDAEAWINIDTLSRGEPIGLYPGDPRSPYNIICTERAMILQLGPKDYEATLRPFHKEVFQKTVEFLHQHNVLPDATAPQLKKVAPYLRQKRVARGRIFIHSGDYQRHIYLMRDGSCSILVHDSADGLSGAVPLDEEEDDEDLEDEGTHDKFLQMRASSYGADMQRSAAYDSQKREVVKSMARSRMRKTLGGHRPNKSFRMSDGDLTASATLSEPGLMLGEEAFVHDNIRDWMTLRNCYSVRAAKNCYLYVADITAFKLFITYLASGSLTQMVSEKLNRRCKQFTRGQNVAKRINKRAQEMKASELEKFSRQKLRLPRCAGYPAVDELDNLEDYLDVVFEHRKPPPNTQLPTLSILEGTSYGPKGNRNGPAVTALLKAVAEDGTLRPSRSLSHLSSMYRESSCYDENPMGGEVSSEARYLETAPPTSATGALAVEDGTANKALTRGFSLPEVSSDWGGVFLNTEVNFDDGMTVTLQGQTLETSASLPNLHLPHAAESSPKASKAAMETSPKANAAASASRAEVLKATSNSNLQTAASKRHQRIMKSFNKVIPGKSVLTLTDKKDLKKQITRVLLSDDSTVSFIKTSSDLWQRLRDAKSHFDALIIDLTKSELQIEAMLRTIRSQDRYSQVPIVVLSQERDLPEFVCNSCSFVVFLPLAASMLREALVWCWDRKSAQKLFASHEPPQDSQALTVKATGMTSELRSSDATLIA